MPIDLTQVDWLYVVILAVFVFLATGLGNLLSFSHRGMAAVLSALIFAALFIGWTYYPHGLPLPTSLAARNAPAATPAKPIVPEKPVVPEKPRNPVTDITPQAPR
jgi:hypothetical protein